MDLTAKTIIEIILLAIVNYLFIRHLQRTRGGGLIAGFMVIAIVIVLGFGFVITQYELPHLRWIANSALPALVFALLIIFQPELRLGITRIGSLGFVRTLERLFGGARAQDLEPVADAIVAACRRLQKSESGALIGIQQRAGIEGFASAGSTRLNAELSGGLIEAVFNKDAPLHDGAMLIISGRIMYAGCHLPLSENPRVSQRLGTRHRAGLALAEESDALVIIISEETGRISLAHHGELERNVSLTRLKEAILSGLITQVESPELTRDVTRDAEPVSDSEGKSKMRDSASGPAVEPKA